MNCTKKLIIWTLFALQLHYSSIFNIFSFAMERGIWLSIKILCHLREVSHQFNFVIKKSECTVDSLKLIIL